MAQFNPQIPDTNDPNWLGWSKSISQPSADSSTGELLSTIGTGIGEGAKVADFLVKGGVENETYDKTRALQNEWTSALEKADISTRLAAAGASGGGGTPTTPTQAGPKAVYDYNAPPQNILAADVASKLPGDLKSLPGDLSLLDSARGNDKLSATAYEGRLVALAKDLRAKYPGYRDYIDTEIEKVSQRDIANKYANSLLGDINSFVGQGKEMDKQVRAEIMAANKLGVPGMDKVWQQYVSGQLGPPDVAMAKVMQVAAPVHTLELQLKLSEARRKERQGSDQDTARDVEDESNKFLRGQSMNFFNVLHLTSGAPTADQISEIIRKANSGEISLDDTQAKALGQSIRQQRSIASTASDDFLNTLGPDGRSRISILGRSKAEDLKKNHLARFDEVADLIENKQYGRAFDRMNSIRALGDDDQYRLLTDPEMGQYFRNSKAIDGMKLDKYSKEFFQGELGNLTAPKFQTWLKKAGSDMLVQPQSANGVVTTLKSKVEELQKKTQGASTPGIAKTYDGLIRTIEFIADPKNTDLNAKHALASAAFDPSNLGLLTKFDEDTREGGVYKPGKYNIFNRLYDQDMTKATKQLGGNTWDQYKDLGKQMWGRELFGPVLQRFSQSSNPIQDNPDVTIGWDSDNYRFKEPKVAGPPSMARDNYKAYLKTNIDRLNQSFSKIANIAKEEGTDPNALILGWMKEFGVDTGRLPGIPQKMMQEIIRANAEEATAKKTFEERYTGKPAKPKAKDVSGRITDSALPFDVEDAPSSGSLGAFLSNPFASGRGVPLSRNNVPPSSARSTRGTLKGRGNLSDESLVGMAVQGDDQDAFAKINANYGQ